MAYGAMFRNGAGDQIIGTEEFTFYVRGSGAARVLQGIGASPDYDGSQLWYGPSQWLFGSSDMLFPRLFYAATSLTHIGITDALYGRLGWRANPRWALGDLCFWRPGSAGIYWMDGYHLSSDLIPPSAASGVVTPGSQFYCARPTGAAPDWIVMTLARAAVTSTVGMQLRNAANQITFDSRQPLMAIEHSLIIPAAVMANVLENDATHTITLPRAVPNAFVCSPIWQSYYRVNEVLNARSDVHLALLRQTSPTTLTVTRHTAPGDRVTWSQNTVDTIFSTTWPGAPGSGDYRSYYFDTPLFISRGIL